MDNALLKTRLQPNPYLNRKRNSGRNKVSFKEKLGLQIALCMLILMFAGIIKVADTAVTRSMNNAITNALSEDIDVSQLTKPVMSFISSAFGYQKSSAEADTIDQIPDVPKQASDSGKAADSDVKQSDAAAASSIRDNTSKDAAASGTAQASVVKYKGIFITPAAGVLGATFGDTTDQLTQKVKSHKGIDIEAANGTDIKAAAGGIVIDAAFEKTLGYYVKIEHNNGFSTIYAQCSQLVAKKGQNVNQGDVIAKVGSTGASNGSHLHFELWKDGKAVNPLDYFKVTAK